MVAILCWLDLCRLRNYGSCIIWMARLIALDNFILTGIGFVYMASKEDKHQITLREKIVMAVVCALAVLRVRFRLMDK